MRKVAVLFGGKSCENEISVLTGVFVLNLLDREKYLPIPVFIGKDGVMYSSASMFDLTAFRGGKTDGFPRVFFESGCLYSMQEGKKRIKKLHKIDVALNCCHGGLGEGGGVSAIMEWNNIPLASPKLTASGVFMDKCMTKTVARALGVPTVDYIRVNEKDYQKRGAFLLKSVERRLKYPVVVKPAHLGSSIGISVANDEKQLKMAIETAFALDTRLLIEKYLKDKQDVNCAAYTLKGDIIVSEPESAFGTGIYSFEEKYIKRKTDGGSAHLTGGNGSYVDGETTVCTAKSGSRYALNGDLRDKIRAYTKTLYKRMNLCGVVRMDFLVSEGKAYLCEVNTVPGSLAYYLFCERISDAKHFFSDLIEEAFENTDGAKKIVTTGILNNVQWVGK